MTLNHLCNAVAADICWSTPEADAAPCANVVDSDLMSDVLMTDEDRPLLLTSLVSDQSIRTAHVVGAAGVLIANNKTPPPEMVALATKLDIPLARTHLSKFEAAVALGKALGR